MARLASAINSLAKCKADNDSVWKPLDQWPGDQNENARVSKVLQRLTAVPTQCGAMRSQK